MNLEIDLGVFEFKLIGFMTLHQFYYVLVFGGIAVTVFFIRVVPYLNYLTSALFMAIGVGLAFGKYNDRPIDNLIKNLIIHLTQPTQYLFKKNNEPPEYLQEVIVTSTPKMISSHQIATKYLNTYKNSQIKTVANTVKNPPIEPQKITQVTETPSPTPTPSPSISSVDGLSNDSLVDNSLSVSPQINEVKPEGETILPVVAKESEAQTPKAPFVSGVIRNIGETPLGNILVYFKSPHGSIVRLVKTNSAGVFASFHPLPLGDYIIEPKDLNAKFFFDTINITVEGTALKPITIHPRSI